MGTNTLTNDTLTNITALAEERAALHAKAEAEAALDAALVDLTRAVFKKPAPPVVVESPRREPEHVVHFGLSPEVADRIQAIRDLAAKKAAKAKIHLAADARLWQLAFVASAGYRHRMGSEPCGKLPDGTPVWPLYGRHGDPRVMGHVTITPGQGFTGVKVYDPQGRVMFCLGKLRIGDKERWSPFTAGFNQARRAKPELFEI